MFEQTALLALPYILPSQAQKHVTHNEALRMLDVLVQLRITELYCITPPDSPSESACYGIGATPEGAFSGHSGQVATFALDVAGTVRSATGFRIGDALLQNGSNAYQLNTSSHFSNTGLFAV